jgi:MFS family permease
MSPSATITSTRAGAIAHDRTVIIFSGLVIAMLMAALDATIVATALPTIVVELGGIDHISWVVTAYLLAQTIVTPLYGKLGDLYGHKAVLQVAIILFLHCSANSPAIWFLRFTKTRAILISDQNSETSGHR